MLLPDSLGSDETLNRATADECELYAYCAVT
jgi:hypothetical protein